MATYHYNAVNAPISKTLGNGVQLTIGYNNRYQATNHEWKDGSTTLTGYSYGFDSVGNRLYSENLVTPSKSEHFSFDDLNRLTNFDQGTLNPSKTGIASVTSNQNWNLDEVGNWATFTDNGTSSTNIFSSTHENEATMMKCGTDFDIEIMKGVYDTGVFVRRKNEKWESSKSGVNVSDVANKWREHKREFK